MNLNVSPMDLISSDDGDQCHKPFGSNNQVVSSLSSSSVSCHIFFNQTDRDQIGYCHHRLYQPQYLQDDTYASQGGSGSGSGSSCVMKNTVENNGFKFSLKSEKNITYPVKWMSSKMRLMQKMKNPDRFPLQITTTSNIDVTTNLEDHNLHPISSSFEIDLSNNNSSYNNSSSSSFPVRVCSDCNTTKTPLWRSGPKGPKSLCNACGIRQRKARRALAAAAAVSTVVSSTTDQPSAMKIKVQQKDKTTVKNGNVTQLKKRYKMAAAAAAGGGGGGSPSNVRQKKLSFEDFLINLSENLKFHRVFPEDEKDAAILLMALSSGLVHG